MTLKLRLTLIAFLILLVVIYPPVLSSAANTSIVTKTSNQDSLHNVLKCQAKLTKAAVENLKQQQSIIRIQNQLHEYTNDSIK